MKSLIPIGPFHPLQEEPELFLLELDGETVVGIDIQLGYNHRGIEKLSEAKTYEQITFLVERICGICSNSHPLAYVQAVEEIIRCEVPKRALYIRAVIAELERIHSHLLWLGLAGHFLGYNTVWMWAWKYREPVLEILELLTGNRNHYAMMKIGGVRRDIERKNIEKVLKALKELEGKLSELTQAILDDPVLHLRLKGIGVLSREDIREYGALGPTARASGVEIDVRKNHPYSVYNEVEWKVITQESGDVFGKAVVRCLECFESIKIIQQCLEKMSDGEIDALVKEIPAGEGIGLAEAPRGEVFHYVLSDGSNQPLRHKIRAPSYMNIPTCQVSVQGAELSDAVLILAGIDPCYCCTERLGVVDYRSKARVMSGEDLVRLSQAKTARIKKEL